jgi:hypothetical protein
MEGIVAKQVSAQYTPDATTWMKIKNRAYSQAAGAFAGPAPVMPIPTDVPTSA